MERVGQSRAAKIPVSHWLLHNPYGPNVASYRSINPIRRPNSSNRLEGLIFQDLI